MLSIEFFGRCKESVCGGHNNQGFYEPLSKLKKDMPNIVAMNVPGKKRTPMKERVFIATLSFFAA
jgi:hypothetical protein